MANKASDMPDFDGMEYEELAVHAQCLWLENAKMRDMLHDLYCIAYEHEVSLSAGLEAYNRYGPCDLCHERHGGKSPCAGTAENMSESCCNPIQAEIVAARMRKFGIEVDDG